MHLSSRLNRLAPSATLAMSQKSSEMKAAGIDVINSSVNRISIHQTISRLLQKKLLMTTGHVILLSQDMLTSARLSSQN